MTGPTRPRRPGRPPSVRSRLAVLEAALAALAEGGPGSVTVDALATRAGVSKATIYRHWSCKQDICKEAVATLRPRDDADEGVPSEGADQPSNAATASAALERYAIGLARTLSATHAGRRMAAVAAAAGGDPVLGRIWEQAVFAPYRRAIKHVLLRAVEDGTARPDLDVDLTTELMVAPVLRRLLLRDTEGLEQFARDVATAVWGGARAPKPGA